MAKRTASTQCSNEARQSPQSHKEPGRKDTAQPMYAIVPKFADFVRTHSIYKNRLKGRLCVFHVFTVSLVLPPMFLFTVHRSKIHHKSVFFKLKSLLSGL